MTTGRVSLASQLAQLDQPTPIDYDPEDLTIHGGPFDNDQTASSGAREHYFEVGPSSLRKLHDSIADPKYEGTKISRKMLMETSDTGGEGGEGDSGEVEDESPSQEEEEEDEDEVLRGGERWSDGVSSGGEQNGDGDEDEDEGEGKDEGERNGEETTEGPPEDTIALPLRKAREETAVTGDLQSTLQQTREEDLRKGKAVVRQLSTWDCLLDARICFQKTATAVNKVVSSTSRTLLESSEREQDLHKYLDASILLAEDLFELQETILTMNELVEPPPRKKRRIQEEDDVRAYATYFTEASVGAANLEQTVHPWLAQTLAKWSAKIQAVAPSTLLPSNRNAFSKQSQLIKPATQLVDEALLDRPRLLAKTRIQRGRPKAETEDGRDEDPEIFDDTDFYQQMLRDVIESRGDGTGAAEDWQALQREKKAKKKVDTKASKGRKLRYGVHEKLQNFMVPVPIVGAWHEEQIDELFASLLGKGFENSIDGVEDLEPEKSTEIEEAIREGFRVFG